MQFCLTMLLHLHATQINFAVKNYSFVLHTCIAATMILLTSCAEKKSKLNNADFSKNSFAAADSDFTIKTTPYITGLTAPVGLTVANDGSNRLFVLEQPGRIRIIKNGKLVEQPFLDITSKVDELNTGYSEKGLLGLAFHPQYKTNGRFFVYYSAPSADKNYDHKSVIAEFKTSSINADVADTAEQFILTIDEPESNHNGGQLAFGNDGYLYISTGDGGGAGDKHGIYGNGQNLNTLLAKILRINVDNSKPYTIPYNNPFINKNARAEIYAYGLRNPWRFSFDRPTGKLFCGDVGQNAFEEVDIIEKGKNYGWRIMEGYHCYDADNCNREGLTNPIYEYTHSEGISITGGYVYHGAKIPALNKAYVFGDYSGKLFCLVQQPDSSWKKSNLLIASKSSNDMECRVNSFGEDEAGELYILTQKLSGPKDKTGVVYRIDKQ